MLKIGKLFMFAGVGLFTSSCNSEKRIDSENNYSHNFNNYQKIYQCANDSLTTWIQDSLALTKFIAFGEWKLESSLCFNSDSTRFFTTVNFRNSWFKNASQDDIHEFGGAFIKGKWYFFFLSGTMVVPREMYKKDVHTPLSFQTLSKLAHKELHSKAFIFAKNGTYKVDEEFFKRTFNSDVFEGCEGNRTEACYDSMTLVHSRDKYKYKLSKEEIEEIKRAMKESESII